MPAPSYTAHRATAPPADPAVRGGDQITAVSHPHRPSGHYERDVRGLASAAMVAEESRCTEPVRLTLSGRDTGYVIAIPVRGPIRVLRQGRETYINPGEGAVFGPLAEATMDTVEDHDYVLVRLDAGALEGALDARLGSAVRRPIELAPTMELHDAAGRWWVGTVRTVLRGAGADDVLANQTIAAPLLQSLLDAVLAAVAHPYRDALDASVRSWAPHAVRRWVDTIEAFPERPLTTAVLATDAGTSVRALEASWHRHLDSSPGDSLRGVRLGRAHGELAEHSPDEVTAGAIGYRWGYARTARFGADYTRRYGLPPEQTLRGPAYA
jgi:AraC-like DNA-binding protein